MNPFRHLANWFRGAESRSTLTHDLLGLTAPYVAGVAVTPESALGVSAVFCADRVLSEGVGTLPKIVYRDADGKKERAKQHPLYKVLRRRPNPEQTAAVFWNVFQHRVNLWGYGACEIVRDGAGQVRELWNLDPQSTRIDRVGGRLVFEVPAQGGGRVTLPRDDVYFVPGPSPDGSVGYRILHYARLTLGMAIAAQRFGSAVFANSPRPGAVLKTKGRLSPEAYANLRASWQALYSGPDQAGKPAVLEEDLDYVPMPFVNNEQLQLEELSQFLVVEVCRFFNVSPVKVHDLGRATWSNLEQLDTDFVRSSLRPHLVKQEQEADARLLAPAEEDEYYVEHLVDELLRADTAVRFEAYAKGITNGFLTINECRAMENRPPLPGGDVARSPLNTAPTAGPTPEPKDDPNPEPDEPAPDGNGNPKPAE